MTTDIDISPEQRELLLAILHRHLPGVIVWAYGSRVKGGARPNSDLDLVVFTTPAQRPQMSPNSRTPSTIAIFPSCVDLHVWDEIPERFHEIIGGRSIWFCRKRFHPCKCAGIAPRSDIWKLAERGMPGTA